MHIWHPLAVFVAFLWTDVLKVVCWQLPGESDRRRAPAPAGTHRRRRTGPAADPSSCVPNGLSVFYDDVFYVPEPNGQLYGYDSSDKRYRDPVHSNYIPGGNATLVYSHSQSSQLWIGGTHISLHDEEYKRCIGVGAVVDLTAPLLYQLDKYPYWTEPYPVYDPRPDNAADPSGSGTFPQIAMPDRYWSTYYSQIETFIDDHLSQGRTVWMYDSHGDYWDEFVLEQEACGAAAAVAVTYIARKGGLDVSAALDVLMTRRPNKTCFRDSITDPNNLPIIQDVIANGRRLKVLGDGEQERVEASQEEEEDIRTRMLLEADIAKLKEIRAEVEAEDRMEPMYGISAHIESMGAMEMPQSEL